jgi:hypothetical protein
MEAATAGDPKVEEAISNLYERLGPQAPQIEAVTIVARVDGGEPGRVEIGNDDGDAPIYVVLSSEPQPDEAEVRSLSGIYTGD